MTLTTRSSINWTWNTFVFPLKCQFFFYSVRVLVYCQEFICLGTLVCLVSVKYRLFAMAGIVAMGNRKKNITRKEKHVSRKSKKKKQQQNVTNRTRTIKWCLVVVHTQKNDALLLWADIVHDDKLLVFKYLVQKATNILLSMGNTRTQWETHTDTMGFTSCFVKTKLAHLILFVVFIQKKRFFYGCKGSPFFSPRVFIKQDGGKGNLMFFCLSVVSIKHKVIEVN